MKWKEWWISVSIAKIRKFESRMKGILIPLTALLLLPAIVFGGDARVSGKKKCISPAAVEKALASTPQRISGSVVRTTTRPAGNIVVLEADPQLLILPNPFDLKTKAIRFQPALGDRFTYQVSYGAFNGDVTETITLIDDDSFELVFNGFRFPFEGRVYDRCFINSNGNITFEQEDVEPPNIEVFMDGPPRIAPFFADLNPENSGTVFVRTAADSVTISWLRVPEFFNQNQFDYGQNTFQVVLYNDGRIDLVYSSELTATQALVGITPGFGRAPFRSVDFSKGTLRNHALSSLVEDFRDYESVDVPGLMKSLYQSYPDRYDFVTLLSNFNLTPVPGVQAFAINVQNDVRGIGNPSGGRNAIFKDNKRYGSAGALQNITFLGDIHQYPANAAEELPDTDTSLLQILAHEVGHRWLSYIKASRNGGASDALLGRDRSHWSFFFDSDGSFLEGNQIHRESSNSFLTLTPFQGYSELDLYLMGLFSPEEVGESFFVEGANNFSPDFPFSAESEPERNVRFRGTAVPITISDIIAVNGSRKPDVSSSQKDFRHLFVLIVKKETPATEEDIAFSERLRIQWESFFSSSTGQRGIIHTGIQ